MSLVSNLFLLFVAASVLVYYLVPGKLQWIVLLAFSYIYYVAGGPRYVVFILFSTLITWLSALLIEKTEEKGNHKGARRLLILGLNRAAPSSWNFFLYLPVLWLSPGCLLEEMQGRKTAFKICAVCIFLSADPSGTHRKIQPSGTAAVCTS